MMTKAELNELFREMRSDSAAAKGEAEQRRRVETFGSVEVEAARLDADRRRMERERDGGRER